MHFHLAQVGGRLVRVAVTLYQPTVAKEGHAVAAPVVRQVARPLGERLPGARSLLGGGSGLWWVLLLALALTAVAVLLARAASGWLQHADVSLVRPLQRMRELPSMDMNASARETVMELAPLIAAKRFDFALEGPDTLWAPGDAALLGELMPNLLANAIHHTPVHGRLGVLLRDSTGRREMLVWDEGPGIDDAAGLESPTSGRIFIDGHDVTPPARRSAM